MEEPYERLRRARERAGYAEATAAARAFGWNENTYRSHENGERGLKPEVARRYARAFKVSAAWLLTGEGGIENRMSVVPVMGRVGAGAEILIEGEDWPVEGLFEIESHVPLPEDVIALEVIGNSMWPRYDEGDIIIVPQQSSIDEVLGWEAAVRTRDGRRFLKRVLRGGTKSTYDLESHNAPPMRGVHLEWVAAVLTVVRAGQWRKLTTLGARHLARKIAS